jgi:site-specific recombinase XerD
MDRIITQESIQLFITHLYEEEKAPATIQKYTCDLEKLRRYAAGRKLDKALLIAYKEKLLTEDHYQTSSINSYLIAANRFFDYMGGMNSRCAPTKFRGKHLRRPPDPCRARNTSVWCPQHAPETAAVWR